MIDTHCHLTHPRLRGDENAVLERAREAGLDACVTIGTGPEDAGRVIALTHRHEGYVFGTAGIDPFSAHQAGDAFDDVFARLESLFEGSGLVALGEIGLDYHYDLDPRSVQAQRFEKQLDLAVRLRLPVVVHVREAHEDMAAILSKHSGCLGVIHSFTGGPGEAERYLDLGWYLAFNGVVTFPKAPDVRDAARMCPADRLLIETDAPFLAPVPVRGRRCEPAHVSYTLDCLAATREVDTHQLDETTSANARRLFGL